MNFTTSLDITWERFASCQADPKMAFEALTRQLFNQEFCPGVHLQSADNNPGVEVEPVPVTDKNGNKKWISFQSKHFDKSVKYDDIKDSCLKAVKHYKGKLNVIYLYCNLRLNRERSSTYRDAEKLLNDAGIKLVPITNEAILDMLRRPEYANLALYYFGIVQLSSEWFKEKAEVTFDYLDERFNRLFNIDTATSAELSLFLHDDAGIASLNKRKSVLIDDVQKSLERQEYSSNKTAFLTKLLKTISGIPDVTIKNINDVFGWDKIINDAVAEEIGELQNELQSVEKQREELNVQRDVVRKNDDKDKEDLDNLNQRYSELVHTQRVIEDFLNLTKRLEFSPEEQQLISNNILFIQGVAGIGKSHLLANELHELIAHNKAGVLILGLTFLSSDFADKQILNSLDVSVPGFSFKDFVNILDNYGVMHDQIVPLMIDAINESWNKDIWKIGLDRIISAINTAKNVRLIVTYRTEYRRILLSDSLKRKTDNGIVVTLNHYGFQGIETEALRTFLDYYNIPFSPDFYFSFDISNPLFLSLFCKTYKPGEEQSLPSLYERLMYQVNSNVSRRLKLEIGEGSSHIFLSDLVDAFCEEGSKLGHRSITRTQLMGLSTWKRWGLQGKEGDIITELIREKFFCDLFMPESTGIEEESYYFAYDQMFDYYCAKYIVNSYKGKTEELIQYFTTTVLKIENGRTVGYGTQIFIIACALCGKDGFSIFDKVLDQITDGSDRYELVHSLMQSYSWRRIETINEEELFHIINKYSVTCEDVCKLLISNSMKVEHPFNAEFMHAYLMRMKLNQRDYVWTVQINSLVDEENRLWQLVRKYERGESLEYESEEQKKLFIITLSWLLTSSNRTLRDHTSKAIVEILKDDFSLCEWLLRKFDNVNDPYVIQRLYTIVVGAVLKRKSGERDTFKSLAGYVYSAIFDQEYVYPDILLRDSARTIIERFLYEYPDEAPEFDVNVFRPPYRSQDIPVVERKEYKDSPEDEKNKLFGVWNITHSLHFEGMGMYGDFGRYVFQSAIDYFDVPGGRWHNGTSLQDDENSFQGNIYYYALHYIFEELGYTNELFGEYDSSLSQYSYFNRSEVLKTERIGKKYEWIAMHNILARISDRYKVHDFNDTINDYEGPWNPDVRDFDPTYNHEQIIAPESVPSFEKSDDTFNVSAQENYIDFGRINIKEIDGENKHKRQPSKNDLLIEEWLFKKINFFKATIKNILLEADDKTQWVVLSRYIDKNAFQQNDINGNIKKFDTWSWTVPFVARQEEAEDIVCCILQHRRGSIHGISEYDLGTLSGVYNREYPWSPSCTYAREEQWQNLELHNYSNDRDRTVADAIIVPELDLNSNGLQVSESSAIEEVTSNLSDAQEDKSAQIKAMDNEFREAFQSLDEEKLLALIKKYRADDSDSRMEQETTIIGRAMSATTSVSVSLQYDATAFDNSGTGYSVTCLSPDITEKLQLSQGSTDGFFYDEKGELAVIDTDQYGGHTGIVIRKDLLDKYLHESNMSLFWVIYGEKQIFAESHRTQEWSEWEGAFLYKDGKPTGRLQGFRGNQN